MVHIKITYIIMFDTIDIIYDYESLVLFSFKEKCLYYFKSSIKL